ncbi:hypothetical protein GQX73_g711 [Xylaria multiplex]|uniref:Uncharacterized protein n=1 Tax=Xylaria multiplex TaxID=323545 RepID=A0A7C8J384_9PEZI|nr:hypothetical protein GQX73_g711 [Xylaria multiplex]
MTHLPSVKNPDEGFHSMETGYLDIEASKLPAEEVLVDENDLDCDVGDFDIAVNHTRNKDLRAREKVEKFFRDVQTLKSLADPSTCEWLGGFPLDMYNEVFPLFDDDDSSTGYQLHPSFTNLPLQIPAANPHPEIFCLSVAGEKISLNESFGPHLVMGIGRLFVSTNCGNDGWLSKWTGYEVFVDYDLGLWMVFDDQSKSHNHGGWYQFGCKLLSPQSQDLQDGERTFGYAKFCNKIGNISSNSFDNAMELVRKTQTSGSARINQIGREEIIETLHIRPALMDAIGGGIATLSKFRRTHNPDVFRRNLTSQMFVRAAEHKEHGCTILSILLHSQAFKDSSYYQATIEAAVKSQDAEFKLWRVLLMLGVENWVAMKNSISREAVAHAVRNEEGGREILGFLVRIGGNAVKNHISSVLDEDVDKNTQEIVKRCQEFL